MPERHFKDGWRVKLLVLKGLYCYVIALQLLKCSKCVWGVAMLLLGHCYVVFRHVLVPSFHATPTNVLIYYKLIIQSLILLI